MKLKKLISLTFIVVLVLSLAACGSSKPASSESAAQPAAEPTAAPAAEASAPAADGLKDGEYKAAQDKYDDYGWKGQITVTVKEGKISAVDFDYVNKDNKLKSQDQGYIKAMEDKTKINLAKAMEELEASLLSSQDASAVNAVSGATSTSNDFKALAEAALKDAK